MRSRTSLVACVAALTLLAGVGLGHSPGDTRIVFASNRLGSHVLFLMNGDGTDVRKLTAGVGDDPDYRELSPTWSPDGSRIAFDVRTPEASNVWVIDAEGSNMRQITDLPGYAGTPAWSPDGSLIAFGAGDADVGELHVTTPDGAGIRQVTTDRRQAWWPAWRGNGAELVYSSSSGFGADIHLRVVPLNGDGEGRIITQPGSRDGRPSWATRGSLVAYDSNPGFTRQDIWVIDVDSGEKTRLMNTLPTDSWPDWDAHDAEIAFATYAEDGSHTDLYAMSPSSGSLRRITSHPAYETSARWDRSAALGVSAAGKQPFTWGWMKSLRGVRR